MNTPDLTDNTIYYRRSPKLSEPGCSYPGFHPGTEVLKKGTVYRPGHKPLSCDILVEWDVGIPVRDGVILYADIFRPAGEEQVPAILNSTPFGKGAAGENPVLFPLSLEGEAIPGVPMAETSGLNTFEAVDPGFFVPHGYAVINLDMRGAFMSGGKNPYFGSQDAEDSYDVIEWLAARDWCSGAVTMSGNSWLGINQWFAGAVRPPHLACLAPWEGWHDMYRDEYMVGGIANYPGFRYNNVYNDDGMMEDVIACCAQHPFFDAYWEDKQAKAENINVPLYVTASWSSNVHCQGTFAAWRKVPVEEKWLRVHNTQEWGDTVRHQDELLRFFDRYMKHIDNGWEDTPKIRISVLDPGGSDLVERVEDSFPLERRELLPLYLNADTMTLGTEAPQAERQCGYVGCSDEILRFETHFTEETELVGYMNAVLWVECDGYNEMDLFLRVAKVDKDGNLLRHYMHPGNDKFGADGYCGPTTRQRVSLRKLDPARSAPDEPYHPFNEPQKLHPGEIVEVQCGLFPTGLRFHPGEGLILEISGSPFYELPTGYNPNVRVGTDNNGRHIIHTGGAFPSRLIVPRIPVEPEA